MVHFVAEWVSVKELEALQCVLKAREKEYEEFLSDRDDQVWKEMSEEWQRYLMGKKKALPCDQKMCPTERLKSSRQNSRVNAVENLRAPAAQPAGSCD